MRSLAIDSSLEGIAGVPLAMLTVPNTASNPLDIGPTEARILYVVASTTELSNYTPIANIGDDANGASASIGNIIIRSGVKGVGGLRQRVQTIEGSSAFYQLILEGWPWNTPMVGCGWWDGSRVGSQGYRSAPIVGESTAVGSMTTAPRLWMASISVTTGTTPIATLAYRGVHDLATRTLILDRLMQRYGNL